MNPLEAQNKNIHLNIKKRKKKRKEGINILILSLVVPYHQNLYNKTNNIAVRIYFSDPQDNCITSVIKRKPLKKINVFS